MIPKLETIQWVMLGSWLRIIPEKKRTDLRVSGLFKGCLKSPSINPSAAAAPNRRVPKLTFVPILFSVAMGGCLSDVRAAQSAVGGASAAPEGKSDAVESFLDSRGLRGPCTQVELSLSASKLCDLDILSKSDPMAILYTKTQDGKLEEIGRTEVIMNSLDPVWITKFIINYQFETVQSLVFRIYDIDSEYNMSTKMLKLDEQDFLGEASCFLSEIVTNRGRSLKLDLQNQKGLKGTQFGTLTIHAEETVASRTVLELTFRCSNLENKDIFSKSDPFLRISRVVETGESIPIFKTEVINNNLNPAWKPVTLNTQQFGSKENPLMIECFHFKNNGQHEILGVFQGSIAMLEKLNREKTGENLFVPSSVGTNNKKIQSGQLFVDNFVEKSQHSFLDYISSGFELNFMVAIDFTASNGNPHQYDSLHYIDPTGRLNSYQQAIVGVGDVIQFYDADRRFPAWGFGGKLVNGSVSHCFNLNGTPDQSEVIGVEGIMAAYTMALHNVTLYGPTLFGPVINKAAEIASQSQAQSHSKYFVLLIITDGVLTDLEEAKDAIVRASELPLSILIVGVGNADFKQMEVLDADTKKLVSSSGRVATRDIVQFVPMREMRGEVSVAESLLEELPGQFLTYMRGKGIEPLAAGLNYLT